MHLVLSNSSQSPSNVPSPRSQTPPPPTRTLVHPMSNSIQNKSKQLAVHKISLLTQHCIAQALQNYLHRPSSINHTHSTSHRQGLWEPLPLRLLKIPRPAICLLIYKVYCFFGKAFFLKAMFFITDFLKLHIYWKSHIFEEKAIQGRTAHKI